MVGSIYVEHNRYQWINTITVYAKENLNVFILCRSTLIMLIWTLLWKKAQS